MRNFRVVSLQPTFYEGGAVEVVLKFLAFDPLPRFQVKSYWAGFDLELRAVRPDCRVGHPGHPGHPSSSGGPGTGEPEKAEATEAAEGSLPDS